MTTFDTHLFLGGSCDGQRKSVLHKAPRVIVPRLAELPRTPIPPFSTPYQEMMTTLAPETYERHVFYIDEETQITIFALQGMSDLDVIAKLIEGYKPCS